MASDIHLNWQSRPSDGRYLRRGQFTLDLIDRIVTINHKTIQLPECAFESLVLLVKNSPKPVSFQDLAQASPSLALSQVDMQDKARMHIYLLKKAFEYSQESSGRVKGVPGYGYWLKTY